MTAAVRVIVAPDKFKGTLTGREAAEAMSAGVREVLPDAVIGRVPLADGGEGTILAVLAAGGTRHTCTVAGPLGDPVDAEFAVHDGVAVLEAAQACGLQLIEPTPQHALSASSFGVGGLIRSAWEAGASQVVVGLGGVACTDGGTGMASALGARFLDAASKPVRAGGGWLSEVVSVDLDGIDPRVGTTRFVAATDVTNPLLGPEGAAAVYAPQKGAGPDEVVALDRGLTTLADVVERTRRNASRAVPGAGAAGGLGWGLMTFLGAQVRPGCDLVMELTGLADLVRGADLVLTGEGQLDSQSRYGKGPVALAALAARHGVPTIAVAGAVDVDVASTGFAAVWSLVEQVGAESALGDTAASLTAVTARAVREWSQRSA